MAIGIKGILVFMKNIKKETSEPIQNFSVKSLKN